MKRQRIYHSLLATLIGVTLMLNTAKAQEEAETNLYCIAAKQNFERWCQCNNRAPSLAYANIHLKFDGHVKTDSIREDSIGKLIKIDQQLYSADSARRISTLANKEKIKLDSLYVNVWIGNILYDKEQDFSFPLSDLRTGHNKISKEGSDPCSALGGTKREGYNMVTHIYIDDPVSVYYTGDSSSLNLEKDKIRLKTSDYYVHPGHDPEPVLQVALNNSSTNPKWKTINNVLIEPGGTIYLSYTDIAGNRDEVDNHYFEWMGKTLQFRIVKTLLNGKKTVGHIAAGMKFYPEGPQFSILGARRTYCTKNVKITIQLDNQEDGGYFKFKSSNSEDNYYWILFSGEKNASTTTYHCIMEPSEESTSIYDIKPHLNGNEESPFNEEYGDKEWALQLIDKENTSTFACEKKFTIPRVPPEIEVGQFPATWDNIESGKTFHLPHRQDPYAQLSVNDPYDDAVRRMPYKIVDAITGDTIKTIYNLISDKEQRDYLEAHFEATESGKMEAAYETYLNLKLRELWNSPAPTAKKDSLNSLVNSLLASMTTSKDDRYVNYFKDKLGSWFSNNPKGVRIPGASKASQLMFSHDGGYFIFMKDGGLYKAVLKSDGLYNVIQKSNSMTGATCWGISPNDETLVFQSVNQLYTIPLTGAGAHTSKSLDYKAKGRKFTYNENIFMDNQNILYGDIFPNPDDFASIVMLNIDTKDTSRVCRYPSHKHYDMSDPVVIEPDPGMFYFEHAGWYEGDTTGTYSSPIEKKTSLKLKTIPKTYDFLVSWSGQTDYVDVTNPINSSGKAISRGIKPERTVVLSANDCIYSFDGTPPSKTDAGIYRCSLNGNNGNRIIETTAGYISYSEKKKYLIYSDLTEKEVFKHYIDEGHAMQGLYPDKEIAQAWYSDFKSSEEMFEIVRDYLYKDKHIAKSWYGEFTTNYKKNWIMSNMGIKVYGIEIDKDYHWKLVDGDKCSYDFPAIKVTAPSTVNIYGTGRGAPKNLCAKNGTGRITYNGGGYPPYSYGKTELKAPGDYVDVEGLGYGDTTINLLFNGGVPHPVKITIEASSVGITKALPKDNTCVNANGQVEVAVNGMGTGAKTYTLTKDDFSVLTHTGPSDSYTFSNLSAGSYNLEVSNGSCSTGRSGLVVNNTDPFNVSVAPEEHAATVGGTGEILVKTTNRKQNVTWGGDVVTPFGPILTADEKGYTGIAPDTYNYTATHKDSYNKSCEISGSVTIKEPKFNAIINISEDEDSCEVHVRMTGTNELIAPFTMKLLKSTGETVYTGDENENLWEKTGESGTYTIQLEYGTNTLELHTFNCLQTSITNTYTLTNPVCPDPGSWGTISLSPSGGIDGKDFLISADGLRYNTAKNFALGAGTFRYYIKDEKMTSAPKGGNPVSITHSLTNYFEVDVVAPAPVTGIVDAVDVSCHGLNNGQVSVFNLKGGSGKYQYRVGEGHWHDTAQAITGLSPGVRPVFLRDSENGCAQREVCTILIEQPDTLKIDTFNILHPTCELENGALYTEVEGGNGHYRHDWQYDGSPFYTNGTLGPDSITVFGDTLKFGLYTLQATDNKGCQLAQSFRLEEYFNPQIDSVQISDVLCHGDTNGAIKIMGVSGTAPMEKLVLEGLGFQHNDTIENIDSSFKKLRYGRYEIHAFDTLGCQSGAPYKLVVNQPDTSIYIVVDTIAPVLTKGSSTGRIRSTIYGGNLELKKTVLTDKTGAVTSTRNERSEFPILYDTLKAGSYTISVADSKGCSFITDTLKVIEPEKALSFTLTEKHDALCKAQTGSITVEAEGGWGGYTYKKATDKGHYPGNTFENLYAGRYQITVRDKYGATYTEAITVHEPKDSLQAVITAEQAPTCNNNGSLQVSVKGGTAPYKLFFEDENDTTEAPLPQTVTLNNRPEGGYMLHINDSNGCRFQLGTNLGGTELLNINNIVLGFPTTTGANDGYLETQITGGKAPITHLWKELNGSTFAETGPRLNNIPSGHYEVTVTENGGCGQAQRVYLPEINERSLIVVELGHETAYGAQNGHATLYACIGDITEIEVLDPDDVVKTYSITDSSGGFYFSNDTIYLKNLKGGDYFVSATNSNKKSAYTEFTIEAYNPMEITEETITHARRIGETNGEVSVVVAGGAGDYVFQWTNTANPVETLNTTSGETTSTLANAKAGAYEFKVTDKFGNELTKEYGVLEPGSPLKISIAEYRNESCKGYEDAYVTAQAEGGWGGYQFRWDSAGHYSNGYTWLNLKVRGHYFYLTDKMGVKDSMLVDITEPGYLTSSMGLIDSVNCKGAPDGDFNFNINGGTRPYHYAVTTAPGLWTEDTVARGFAEGTYTFVFTDSNNCTGQDTLTAYMPEPDSLLFKEIDITHTTCDMDNGTITVAMQGGTRPYRYEWSDFDKNPVGSDSVINGLERSGYYFLDVYDMHNCPQHFGQFIKPSANPVITDVDTTPLFCYGDSTGTAQVVSETAGVPYAPYHFTWSNADTGRYAGGYAPGVHSVAITDTNGCSTTTYFEVTTPDSLWVFITGRKDAHCFGYNDGFIEAGAVGGVGGYSFAWSNGDTASLADSLYMGSYSVLLTDTNQCTLERTFEVTEPEKVTVDLGEDIKICPGNTITIDGQAFTTHKWSTQKGAFSEERYVHLSEFDSYYLEVADSIGCFAWDTISITIGDDALKADFLMASEAPLTDTLIVLEMSNLELDSLQWEYDKGAFNDITSEEAPGYVLNLQSLGPGIYNFKLWAYSGGCTSNTVKQVEIKAVDDTIDDGDGLGYKGPLVQSMLVTPNPNDGFFTLKIGLREEADIQVVVFSVDYGRAIDQRMEYGLKEYELGYGLNGLNTGLYVIMLNAKDERKQVKMIIE